MTEYCWLYMHLTTVESCKVSFVYTKYSVHTTLNMTLSIIYPVLITLQSNANISQLHRLTNNPNKLKLVVIITSTIITGALLKNNTALPTLGLDIIFI